MIRHRLYLQIYLSFVAIVVVTVVTAGTVGRLVHGPIELPPAVLPIAAWVARDLPGQDPAAEVDHLGRELGVDLAVFDPGGRPVAAHGDPIPPPDLDGSPSQLRFRRDGPALVAHLPDGRWLGAGLRHHAPPDGHLILALATLVTVSAVGCYPIARRITRRLEGLQAGVEAWGNGALDHRLRPEGDDEVARLGRAFDDAADRIGQLLGTQRRMLASASHELRSPLARLRMGLELLDDGDPARSARIADAIREVEELDGLVADLLLTTRAQALGRITDPQPVDLGRICQEEAARVGAAASGEGHTRGDPAMLRRAVRNLLENARRYGGPNVSVRVTDGRVEVDDDGPGVPADQLERIWEPFHRGPGHREGTDGGVGLGLALVREIARYHAGDARWEPRPGGGSRFVLDVGS